MRFSLVPCSFAQHFPMYTKYACCSCVNVRYTDIQKRNGLPFKHTHTHTYTATIWEGARAPPHLGGGKGAPPIWEGAKGPPLHLGGGNGLPYNLKKNPS